MMLAENNDIEVFWKTLIGLSIEQHSNEIINTVWIAYVLAEVYLLCYSYYILGNMLF